MGTRRHVRGRRSGAPPRGLTLGAAVVVVALVALVLPLWSTGTVAGAAESASCTMLDYGTHATANLDTCAITNAPPGGGDGVYTLTIHHVFTGPLCGDTWTEGCVAAEAAGQGTADTNQLVCPFYTGPAGGIYLNWVDHSSLSGTGFTCTVTLDTTKLGGNQETFVDNVVEPISGPGSPLHVAAAYAGTLFEVTFGPSTPPPSASFTTEQSATDPLTWNFDASGSSASAGHSIVGYAWDFGDHTTGTDETTSHTYASGGTYTVQLTVTDDTGQTATVSHTVKANVLVVNSTGDRAEASPSGTTCDTGGTIGTAPECTLRAAITVADADGGGDTIRFDIDSDASPVLVPTTPYPALSAPVVIDGTTQSGGWVQIDGSTTTVDSNGLFDATGGGTTIDGLSITGYTGTSIVLAGGSGNAVTGDRIGIDPADSVATTKYGVLVNGSTSATISHDVVDTTGVAIEAGGSASNTGLSVTDDDIGVTTDGTALANPSQLGTAGIVVDAETAPTSGVTITRDVVAGFRWQILGGGADLAGLTVSHDDVGVGTGGKALGLPGGHLPDDGVRIDGAPHPAITDDDVAGNRYDIAVAGAVNYGTDPDGDGSYTITVLDPGDPDLLLTPVTGAEATVSDDLVGVAGDGSTIVASGATDGVVVFAGEAHATVSGNTVVGHTTEVSITGGSGDTVAGNVVGEGQHGEAETDTATAGISLSGVDGATVGGTASTAGNTVGDIGGTGISLAAVTGSTVSSNVVGLALDGESPRPDKVGISVDGASTGTTIGPANVASSNDQVGISSATPSITITGNDVGTDVGGTHTRSNGSGILLRPAATGDTVSANVIGGDPSAGAATVGTTDGAEIGIYDETTGATITDNHIGVAVGGTTALGNTDGVALDAGATGTIKANTIADNQNAIVSLGSAVIRSNPTYANTTGITGSGLSATVALGAADRVTAAGVTRTWLAVGGLPTTDTGTIEAFGNTSCADPEGRVPLTLQTPTRGSSTQVVTIIGNTSLQGFTVTYTPATGPTSGFSTCVTATTTAPDTNGDGIPDPIEALGPDSPDIGDPTSARVPTDDGGWIELQLHAADGAHLTGVSPVADPGTEPAGVSFPHGLVSFTIAGLAPGATAKVDEVGVPTATTPDAYWKLGPTTVGGPATWYRWTYDRTTDIGAEPVAFTTASGPVAGFTLNFTDGQSGDDDLAANGSITDPGGAALDPSATTTTSPPTTSPPTSQVSPTSTAAASSATTGAASGATNAAQATAATLPVTGTDIGAEIEIALVALLLGGALLLATRSRVGRPSR